ncbi:MAG: trypsin-like peptidase domain-containing protein [Roseibacillus sp.]
MIEVITRYGWRRLTGPAALFALLSVSPFSFALAEGEDQESERPYFNRKAVPENIRDLLKIQEALQSSLPRTRKATVGIDMGGGAGSGVIVSEDGIVLTAAHVSGGVGKELSIILEDGTKYQATSLGLVANTDAAMMKINEEGTYSYVEIDSKDTAQLGDWVFALGHSGGFDKERGIGVRIGRLVRMADQTIQSDCNLIGGDSGGPLFDMKGRLIGIHSRVGGVLEQNMHVPIREFLRNWEMMKESEFVGEGPFAQLPVAFLGVGTEDREEGGVVVKVVVKDSPAEKAGLKVGDIILAMDGEDLENKEEFSASIKEQEPGSKVTLKILRDDEEVEIEIELGEK